MVARLASPLHLHQAGATSAFPGSPMLRTVLGILAGLATLVVVILLVEAGGMLLYPPPPGIDPSRPDAMTQLVAQLPTGALAMVLLAWVLGALAGGWVAARVARRGFPLLAALAVAGFVMAGVVAMVVSVPHPQWLTIGGLALPIPAAWLGAHLARRRRRRGELPPPAR